MTKVLIRSNGSYNADTIEIEIAGKTRVYDWRDLNPQSLIEVLKTLGHDVEYDDDVLFDVDH